MSNVKHVRLDEIAPSFSERGSSVHEFVNQREGAQFAAGAVYFKDANFAWKLWYDEVLICVSSEKSFEVIVKEVAYELGPGDSIWLPAGTDLIYRSEGLARAYYAVTPVNWREVAPK